MSFGYTKVRGYHPLIAAVTEDDNAPDVLHTRLREGKANTARGAASFVAESLARARAAGAVGELIVRADSGFYNHTMIGACVRAGARFSIAVRSDRKIRAAIAAIPEQDWTPIPYWSSHLDPDTGQLIDSHADVADTTYTAFAGTKHPVTARLVVRRVRRLQPRTGQLELDTDLWRHHPILTDRIEPLLTVEAEHRGHAIIEQVIADLKSSAMAHLPSGSFNANAAWLALAALAHNLTRALATVAGHGLGNATTATIRRTLIAIPARLIRSARRWHLRMSMTRRSVRASSTRSSNVSSIRVCAGAFTGCRFRDSCRDCRTRTPVRDPGPRCPCGTQTSMASGRSAHRPHNHSAVAWLATASSPAYSRAAHTRAKSGSGPVKVAYTPGCTRHQRRPRTCERTRDRPIPSVRSCRRDTIPACRWAGSSQAGSFVAEMGIC